MTDALTGLTYAQQRYYDPVIGRFLSPDPVLTGDAGENFNRYKYAANNPYRFTDPDGRCESISTCQMMHDDMDLAGGKMSRQEYDSRTNARAGGALIGVAVVAAYMAPAVVAEVVGMVKTVSKIDKALSDSTPKLTDAQAKNMARFEKKFSNDNRNVQVSPGKDGTVTMKNEVPGKVPGSKAVYEKTVDSSGTTTSATKTTYDPNGAVVHVKDKLN